MIGGVVATVGMQMKCMILVADKEAPWVCRELKMHLIEDMGDGDAMHEWHVACK